MNLQSIKRNECHNKSTAQEEQTSSAANQKTNVFQLLNFKQVKFRGLRCQRSNIYKRLSCLIANFMCFLTGPECNNTPTWLESYNNATSYLIPGDFSSGFSMQKEHPVLFLKRHRHDVFCWKLKYISVVVLQ